MSRPHFLFWTLFDMVFIGVVVHCVHAQNDYDLAFSTYIGGSAWENPRDITVDAAGNIIVVGGTGSSDYPTTDGAYDRIWNNGSGGVLGSGGPSDVFISKFNPSGQLIWSTLLGGPSYDRAYAVEVDTAGDIYVAGRAGINFPTTSGALQTTFGGDVSPNGSYGPQDGFVAKLSGDGTQLLWSTYFGDQSEAIVRDVDIDSDGNVYVVSPHIAYPNHPHVTLGAFDTTHNGNGDIVVAKIGRSGDQVLWGTFFGGSGVDGGGPSIRVDQNSHEVVIVGNTASEGLASPGAYDTIFNGPNTGTGDVIMAKFTADGSDLVFATYLGGSSQEGAGTHNLGIGPDGKIYAAHWTMSDDIPILPGGLDSNFNGGNTDLIAWQFSPTGELQANTYVGGNGSENVQGVAIDQNGNVYLSVDNVTSTNFPVTSNAYQLSNGGGADAVFLKLSSDLRYRNYATVRIYSK